MGILFAIIAFFQASAESKNLTTEQSTLLFLQKMSDIEHSVLPFASIALVVGLVFLFISFRKRGMTVGAFCSGGCLTLGGVFVGIGTLLPLAFTSVALSAINSETGVITNPLFFWGSIILFVLTCWG